jgi:hypothetical protein
VGFAEMKVGMQREFDRSEPCNGANRYVRSDVRIGVCAERRLSAAGADDPQATQLD